MKKAGHHIIQLIIFCTIWMVLNRYFPIQLPNCVKSEFWVLLYGISLYVGGEFIYSCGSKIKSKLGKRRNKIK